MFQAWHALACFNFSAILFYKQQAAKLNQNQLNRITGGNGGATKTTPGGLQTPLTPHLHSAPDLLLGQNFHALQENNVVVAPPVQQFVIPPSPVISTSQSQVMVTYSICT